MLKSVTNPLVDLTEPPPYATGVANFNPTSHSWVPPPPQNDYFLIPNQEHDPGISYSYSLPSSVNRPGLGLNEAVLYGHGGPASVVEDKLYYPSYLKPVTCGGGDDDGLSGVNQQPFHDFFSTTPVGRLYNNLDKGYAQSLSALEHSRWGNLCKDVEWQQRKQAPVDGSFSYKENYVDQGFFECKNISPIDVAGTQKQVRPRAAGLEYTPFLEEHPSSMPAYYPSTSTLASASAVHESYPPKPSLDQANSLNYQIMSGASYDNQPKKLDSIQYNGGSAVKTYPSAGIELPVNINASCVEDDRASSGKHPAFMDEPYPFVIPDNKSRFDPSLVRFQLEQVDYISPEFPWRKIEALPIKKDISENCVDETHGEWTGTEIPYINLNEFDLEANDNKASNSIDHGNPALDSPCWRGSPVSSLHSCEVYETVTPWDLEKGDVCRGSTSESPQNFPPAVDSSVNFSYVKPRENTVHNDDAALKDQFTSLKGFLVNRAFSEEETNEDVKCGGPLADASSCDGLENFDGIQEPKKGNSLANRPVDILDLNAPEENHVPVVGAACVNEAAAAKLAKSDGRESTNNIDVQTLLNAMHNMSELLLHHISKDASVLKDEECEILQKVINKECEILQKVIKNLDSCVLKNKERVFSNQELLCRPGDTALSNPQKETNVNMPKVQRQDAPNFEAVHEFQHVRGKMHLIDPGKVDGDVPDYVSAMGLADTLKNNKMTQAIKQVLSENFQAEEETEDNVLLYKNLWLEAEASLCSVNYMTRFNRMKMEMELLKSQKASSELSALPKDTVATETPSSMNSSVVSGNNTSAFSKISSMPCISARLHALKSRVDNPISEDTSGIENLATSKAFPDLNKVDEGKNTMVQAIPMDSSSMSGKRCYEDELEASVMSRLNVLKQRDGNSTSLRALALERVDNTRPNFSLDLNKDDKLAHEGAEIAEADLSSEGYSMSGLSSHSTDDESSVMARFSILGHRGDKSKSSSISSVDKPSSTMVSSHLNNEESPMSSILRDGDDVEASVMSRYHMLKSRADYCHSQVVGNQQMEIADNSGVEDRILSIGAILQSYFANSIADKATRGEVHPAIQPQQGWYESPSSDWEHVLKEELSG